MKIAMLEAGEVPNYEPEFDAPMAKNVEAGRLSFTTGLASAAAQADAVFIAVETPMRRGDGHTNLTYVMAAAEEIAHAMVSYTGVVTKPMAHMADLRNVYSAQDAAGAGFAAYAEFDR